MLYVIFTETETGNECLKAPSPTSTTPTETTPEEDTYGMDFINR